MDLLIGFVTTYLLLLGGHHALTWLHLSSPAARGRRRPVRRREGIR